MKPSTANLKSLRELVERRLDVTLAELRADHPHLVDAIEQVKVVQQSVDRLLEDPAYIAAMRAAARDELLLETAEQVTAAIDRTIRVLLGL